jgi:hypothetical protein
MFKVLTDNESRYAGFVWQILIAKKTLKKFFNKTKIKRSIKNLQVKEW